MMLMTELGFTFLTSSFLRDSELQKNYKTLMLLMLLAKLCFERLMRRNEGVVITYRAAVQAVVVQLRGQCRRQVDSLLL